MFTFSSATWADNTQTSAHVICDQLGEVTVESKDGGLVWSDFLLAVEDGLEVSPYVRPPAFATKAAAIMAMLGFIEKLSDEITGKRPLAEKLSWPTKLMIAKEYLANQSGEVPVMIATEAALRETTPAELAQLIVDKGLAFAAASSAIAGLRAKTEAALEAVTDPYDYETVLTAAATQAEALKAQLGL